MDHMLTSYLMVTWHPQVKRAIAWCDPRTEPSDARRITATMLLREMAEQAPAVFNVHVKMFIDAIWFPLRDAKPAIRESGVAALKVCIWMWNRRT